MTCICGHKADTLQQIAQHKAQAHGDPRLLLHLAAKAAVAAVPKEAAP